MDKQNKNLRDYPKAKISKQTKARMDKFMIAIKMALEIINSDK